jgi:hypothetical protein
VWSTLFWDRPFSPNGKYVLWIDQRRKMGICSAWKQKPIETFAWSQPQAAIAFAWHSSSTGWSVLSNNSRTVSQMTTYRLADSKQVRSARVEWIVRLPHGNARPVVYPHHITDPAVFGDAYVP